MMRIGASQLDVFREDAAGAFVDRMVVHVNKHFSSRCASLGAQQTREDVTIAVARGVSNGIRTERHLCQFINLTFAFDNFFDTDPGWASKILQDTARKDPKVKLDMLTQEALSQIAAQEAARHRLDSAHRDAEALDLRDHDAVTSPCRKTATTASSSAPGSSRATEKPVMTSESFAALYDSRWYGYLMPPPAPAPPTPVMPPPDPPGLLLAPQANHCAIDLPLPQLGRDEVFDNGVHIKMDEGVRIDRDGHVLSAGGQSLLARGGNPPAYVYTDGVGNCIAVKLEFEHGNDRAMYLGHESIKTYAIDGSRDTTAVHVRRQLEGEGFQLQQDRVQMVTSCVVGRYGPFYSRNLMYSKPTGKDGSISVAWRVADGQMFILRGDHWTPMESDGATKKALSGRR